ncbi:MAG: cytosine permease [Pseudomonadales bacterium]
MLPVNVTSQCLVHPLVSDAPGEYATERVPDEQTVSWLRVASVSAMVSFSLPSFIAGIEVARATPGDTFVSAILFGALITTVIGGLMGAIGAHSRLSSYMLTRIAFGTNGAALVNMAFAISLLGWFGVNIDLFGAAVVRLLAQSGWVVLPIWTVELFAGVIMTVTTLYGFRAINTLSFVLVPVLMGVTGLLVSYALDGITYAEIVQTTPAVVIDYGAAVSSVVGGIIVGAVILPDITRFIRHWSGAVFTVLLSYLVVSSVVMVAGALAAVAYDNSDLLDIMLTIGLGLAAFAIVIFGSWVLNSLNLYSAMLSVQATLPAWRERAIVIALGVFGTLAAFLNILDYFLDFLFYLAIVFVPVAGILVVDYLWARPASYQGDIAELEGGVSWPALLAWTVGALVALAGSETGRALTGIAAIDAMLVASLGYVVLHWWFERHKTRSGRD